jgi:hypothetical protein
MATLSTVYATDEDVAVRATGDYMVVCPEDQKVASGTDGVIDPAGPWQFTSATGNFTTRGLAPGHVIRLGGGMADAKPVREVFGATGDLFIVDTVDTDTQLTLRRIRQPSGLGMPPGVAVLSGIPFKVLTFAPQIEENSYDINKRFQVDPTLPFRSADSLFDIRELRQLAVLGTLKWAYFNAWRNSQQDAYLAKGKVARDDYCELRDRLVLHWTASSGSGQQSPTTPFSTRLSR